MDMRPRRFLLTAVVGAAAVTACSTLPITHEVVASDPPSLSPAPRTTIRQKAVLAIEWDRRHDRDLLVQLDPRSLRTARGVPIGPQGTRTVAISPDGDHLLLLGRHRARIVDIERMRSVATFEAQGGWPVAVRWVERNRALVVRGGRDTTHASVIDPYSGQTLSSRTIEGSPLRTRRAAGGIVVLTQRLRMQESDAAPAGLAFVGSSGEVDTVTLERIAAGFSVPEDEPYGRSSSPALATGGDEAIVTGTEGDIARVNFTEMSVDYPAPSRSLLGSLSAALLSPADAKFSAGRSLWARWVDDDVLALTGRWTEVGGTEREPRFRSGCAPIRLLDTRDWSLTRWPGTGNKLAVVDGAVITYDGCGSEDQPLGLTAWSGTGEVLWRALPHKHISGLRMRGNLAFVRHGYERVLRSVVDVRDGRVLVTREGFASVLPY